MKITRVLFAGALALSLTCVVPTRADMVTLEPQRAVLLPASEGENRVALYFDLGALRVGEGRRIDEALLEWTAEGLSAETPTTLTVQALTGDWTEGSVEEGRPVIASGQLAAKWRVDAPTLAWTEGRVRFDLSELAAGWAANPEGNHGILLGLGSLDREVAGRQTSLPRLTIRYGFIR